jgi:LuxR family transcriptional regulator, maltose regulon positive regulatory protein
MTDRKLASMAKLTQPSAGGIIPRRRLFRLIDKKKYHPVIWITGPPGSGKTALVRSYLEARKIPCLWYQIDQGDGDVATFFYYMDLAAKKAAPRKRKPLPLLTPEYLQDIPTFTRRYFEKLYGRLLGLSPPLRVPDPVVRFTSPPSAAPDSPAQIAIVFDNYQEAPEGSPFHEVIRQGMSMVPAGINVIAISRRDPPALFARMMANRQMAIIGWNDLRFNSDESKRLIRHRGYKRLPNETLAQLHERTEGWAAGLVLLTEETLTRGLDPLASLARVPEEVFHYFAGEIFNRTNRETQDFLVKSAFLLRMTPSMAEALTGHSQAKRILSDLSRKNYFTQRHEARPTFFQYHPLFREFLQTQGRKRLASDELSDIEHLAASVLEANGQVEDAAELLAKGDHWADLVRLIIEHGPALISQGRNQTLDGWLGHLPYTLLEESPWLLYWKAVCRLPFSPSESGDTFEKAFSLFRARRNAGGVFFSLSGLFDSTTFGLGDFKAYDRCIDLLQQVENEYKAYPSEEIEARLLASVMFAIIARQPGHPKIEEWRERALSVAGKGSDPWVKALTLQALASYWLFAGDMPKAAMIVDLFHEAAQSSNFHPLHVILLKDVEAWYSWMSGSFEECRRAATQGLDLAASTGVHMWDTFLLGHAAAGALSAGDMSEARRLLRRMSASPGMMPTWGKEYFHLLSAWASFVQGDLPGAVSHSELCLALSAETGMWWTSALDRLGSALFLVELKKEKEARDQIDKVRAMAWPPNVPLLDFTFFLAHARLELNLGNEASGLESLKEAMIVGREQGYINAYFWHPPMMADLCKRALDADIEADYVRHLIQKRALFPDPPPYDCDHWPWPLKIFTLGRFELVQDGEPLEFPVRAPRKMLSLIEVLVAFGSKGLSEDQLTEAIWPEADGDMAHQAFATILHRLRRLLGNEKVIQLRRGHLSFDGRQCWIDAHAFEYLLEQADARADMALLQKALTLYRGPFLEGDKVEPWAISYGERLKSKFLRAAVRLGKFLEKNEERDKAIECYSKALEVDGLAEEFYQRQMLCYNASGRKAEALSAYNRCRETLHSVLGVEPCPETQAIYEIVKRKD